MHFCGVVILLSRGEYDHEKNKISYQRGVSEPFVLCQIYGMVLLFYITFSFLAMQGVKDRTMYLIQGHLNEIVNATPRFLY